jgi:protein-L-isoaspartate(D-aspartate) O-methyltransferase
MINDSFRHIGLRRKLVFELQAKGIRDTSVLNAIAEVPRHLFIDNAFVEYAYSDKAFPIESGQTISQPSTVAFQSSLLDLSKGMKVLEIGTGSGYQSSILYRMGAKVFSVERHRNLFLTTKSLLDKLGYAVRLFHGDGFKGLHAYAPFDRVLVTCGATEIPMNLVHQLKPGGIMIIPLGSENEYIMTKIIKSSSGPHEIYQFDSYKFVPMLRNKVS